MKNKNYPDENVQVEQGSSAMGKLKHTSPPHANAGCQRARRPRSESRRSCYTPTRTVSAAFGTMPRQPTRPVDQHFKPSPTCAYAVIPPAAHRQSGKKCSSGVLSGLYWSVARRGGPFGPDPEDG